MITKPDRLGVIVFVAVVLYAPEFARADVVERSFDSRGIDTVRVETDRGAILVRSGTADEVHFHIERRGDTPDDLALDFSRDGGVITVHGKNLREDYGDWSNNSLRVRFEIAVPREMNVELSTRGGSITIDDLAGEVRAETAGGSLDFGQISGPVHARTAGGSIRVEGSAGDTDVQTSGGSISLGDIHGNLTARTAGGSIDIGRVSGSVDARTAGGSIEVTEAVGAVRAQTSGGSVTAYLSQQPVADSRLSTSGGSVTVYLADNLALDIDARASWGKVRSDFELDGATITKRSLRGKMNGGGPELHLQGQGGVRIVRRNQ